MGNIEKGGPARKANCPLRLALWLLCVLLSLTPARNQESIHGQVSLFEQELEMHLKDPGADIKTQESETVTAPQKTQAAQATADTTGDGSSSLLDPPRQQATGSRPVESPELRAKIDAEIKAVYRLPEWTPWRLPGYLLQNFEAEETQRLDPTKFHLNLKVLAFDRVDALLLLLDSLNDAEYLGDEVSLEVFLDHRVSLEEEWDSLDPAEQEEYLTVRHDILNMLDRFTWRHGEKTVHAREVNAGMQPQWIEAWWPENVNHFAFVAEDDMELSPLYYVYLKNLVMFYYYNQTNYNANIYGISIHRQTSTAGVHGLEVQAVGEPFLYPLVGTWGQMVFPIPWRDFRMWYDHHRYGSVRNPSINNTIMAEWFQRKGNKIWTPWQVRWTYVRNMYNLYASFPGNLSLSMSYRLKGVDYGSTFGPDSVLVNASHLSGNGVPMPSVPALAAIMSPLVPEWWTKRPPTARLHKFDWCFREVPNVDLPIRDLDTLKMALHLFGADKELTVIPVPPTVVAYELAKNWLCHVDGLGRHNFLFLVELHSTSAAPGVAEESVGQCLKHARAMNAVAFELARRLAAKSYPVYLVEPRLGLTLSECRKERLESWASPLLSLQQARVVSALAKSGVDVVVSSLGTVWSGDPASSLVGSSAALRFKALRCLSGHWCPSALGISSFVLVVRSSGAQAFDAVLESWATKAPELGLLSTADLESIFNEASIKPVLVQASSEEPFVDALQSGLARLYLTTGSIEDMRKSGFWQVDPFGSCAGVTCTSEVADKR